MLQSLSINALLTSSCGVCCSSNDDWRKNFGVLRKRHTNSGSGRKATLFTRLINRPESLRVQAGFFFSGSGDKDTEWEACCEHSEIVNEDILMFFFELDLATRVQYALNMEQYEAAQQLRNKLTEVESEVIKLRGERRGSSSKSEAQDMAISMLRLRADLQDAINGEDYKMAAELRDKISKLEMESLAASVQAQAYKNVQYSFRLGQKVKHKIYGYRAVICGMDPVCCESKEWMDGANVEKLTRGTDQPFYQVLVNVNKNPNFLVAYVPEENLHVPGKRGTSTFDHPYASFLFLGMDAAGDFIPVKQLREKYNQPRHELPYNLQDEGKGNDT